MCTLRWYSRCFLLRVGLHQCTALREGLQPTHPPVEEGAGGACQQQHHPDVQDKVAVCEVSGPWHSQLLVENIERKEADGVIVLQGAGTSIPGQVAGTYSVCRLSFLMVHFLNGPFP